MIPLLAALLPLAAQAGVRPNVEAKRTATAPVIDGVLDDEVWRDAPLLGPLTQVLPIEGAQPTERTEVRLLYDSDSLYIGVRCFDSDPSAIIGTQMERDAELDPDDRIEIVIDTFHDRRNAFFFQLSPVGSKGDALITDNGLIFNKPWDGIWEGRTTIDEQGWTAEIALPFKTLSFRAGLDTWGFNINRYIKRHGEVARWAGARNDTGIFRISEAGDLGGLTGMEQGIGLDVRPFFVGDWSNDREDKTLEGDPGLDLFYRITSNLTASLTVNTDFAETEVDDRQVNLTRFPLFFPEKRDFFLEDSGIFQFADIRRDMIPFFSRRIGLDSDTGEEVPINWGAKLTGRVGPWNIGVLDVETDDFEDVDNQNLFVSRVSHNFGEQSTIGGIVTSGNPSGGPDNTLVGADVNFRTSEFLGDKLLQSSWWFAKTDTDGLSGDDQAYGASLRYPNDIWSWRLFFLEIDENYNPELGFVPRVGVRDHEGSISYSPRPGGRIRQLEFSVEGDVIINIDDDRVESGEIEVQPFGIEWESGEELRFEFTSEKEDLDEDFDINDDEGITIDAGSYSFARARVEFESSDRRPVVFGSSFSAGEFFNGHRTDLNAGLDWRPSRFFSGGLDYERNDIELPDGSFDVHTGGLRLSWSFSPRVSWNNFIQFDNDSDSLGVNSRLRWIFEPGRELFLVFNETVERSGDSLVPVSQQVAFKIEYTLRF